MGIEAQQLLLLLNWMSPAFPTGQFAYSHGLEWAIDSGQVTCADDLKSWIGDLLTRGSGWNDAVLFARCWEDETAELNELALALALSKERHLETTQLGRSFAIAASVFAACPHPPADTFSHGLATGEGGSPLTPSPVSGSYPGMGEGGRTPDEGLLAYPIAAGTACARMGLEKHHALLAYLQGFCAALTSVAVRLVPIGQTAGLETLRDLMPIIAATATRAATATLDDLGAITLRADIAAMNHETQYSRVFRT